MAFSSVCVAWHSEPVPRVSSSHLLAEALDYHVPQEIFSLGTGGCWPVSVVYTCSSVATGLRPCRGGKGAAPCLSRTILLAFAPESLLPCTSRSLPRYRDPSCLEDSPRFRLLLVACA